MYHNIMITTELVYLPLQLYLVVIGYKLYVLLVAFVLIMRL